MQMPIPGTTSAGTEYGSGASRRRTHIAAALLALAVVLGGGGSPNPVTEMILQLSAVALAACWLIYAPPASWHDAPPHYVATRRIMVAMALMMVALPAIQLVPLPPSFWQALPGRAAESATLTLVGAQDTWMPLSLSPPRTWAALLALGPPIIMMAMVSRLPHNGRRILLAVVIIMAIATALLGMAQVATGNAAFYPYTHTHRGWVTGFQANRNHAADVLIIGLIALVAWLHPLRRLSPAGWLMAGIAGLLLIMAAIFTGSRMGIALLVGMLGVMLMMAAPTYLHRFGKRATLALGAAGMAALALIAAVSPHTMLARVWARFAVRPEIRLELWSDALHAMAQYWPAGAGMGAAAPALIAAERLEAVHAAWPNRAHNDYLELALEAGLPGIIALGAMVVMILFMARKAWHTPGAPHGQIFFALATLGVIALHSIVDYPLRTMSIACLAGMAAGFLVPPCPLLPLARPDEATENRKSHP